MWSTCQLSSTFSSLLLPLFFPRRSMECRPPLLQPVAVAPPSTSSASADRSSASTTAPSPWNLFSSPWPLLPQLDASLGLQPWRHVSQGRHARAAMNADVGQPPRSSHRSRGRRRARQESFASGRQKRGRGAPARAAREATVLRVHGVGGGADAGQGRDRGVWCRTRGVAPVLQQIAILSRLKSPP